MNRQQASEEFDVSEILGQHTEYRQDIESIERLAIEASINTLAVQLYYLISCKTK